MGQLGHPPALGELTPPPALGAASLAEAADEAAQTPNEAPASNPS
jgi:hypothetical protein